MTLDSIRNYCKRNCEKWWQKDSVKKWCETKRNNVNQKEMTRNKKKWRETKRNDEKQKEMTWSDSSWRFACGDVFVLLWSARLPRDQNKERSHGEIRFQEYCSKDVNWFYNCDGHTILSRKNYDGIHQQTCKAWKMSITHCVSRVRIKPT